MKINRPPIHSLPFFTYNTIQYSTPAAAVRPSIRRGSLPRCCATGSWVTVLTSSLSPSQLLHWTAAGHSESPVNKLTGPLLGHSTPPHDDSVARMRRGSGINCTTMYSAHFPSGLVATAAESGIGDGSIVAQGSIVGRKRSSGQRPQQNNDFVGVVGVAGSISQGQSSNPPNPPKLQHLPMSDKSGLWKEACTRRTEHGTVKSSAAYRCNYLPSYQLLLSSTQSVCPVETWTPESLSLALSFPLPSFALCASVPQLRLDSTPIAVRALQSASQQACQQTLTHSLTLPGFCFPSSLPFFFPPLQPALDRLLALIELLFAPRDSILPHLANLLPCRSFSHSHHHQSQYTPQARRQKTSEQE